jgi:hypothetical protein
VLTLKASLISLQSLLTSPEPSNPQDAEVAKHYMADRRGFDNTARYEHCTVLLRPVTYDDRYWAKVYAGADGGTGTYYFQLLIV